jgi:hypothetical protein
VAHPTKRALIAKASLYEMGYEYLRDNFHKFNKKNKMRVSIEIVKIYAKIEPEQDQNAKRYENIMQEIRAIREERSRKDGNGFHPVITPRANRLASLGISASPD